MNAPRLLDVLKAIAYTLVVIAAVLGIYRLSTMHTVAPLAPAPITAPAPTGPVTTPPPSPRPDAAPVAAATAPPPTAAPAAPPKPKARVPSNRIGVAFYCRNYTAKNSTVALCLPSERACAGRAKIGRLASSSNCFPSGFAYCFAWQADNGSPEITCGLSEIDCSVWANINPRNTTDCFGMTPAKFIQTAAELLRNN